MKKILLFSAFVLTGSLFSCSGDTVPQAGGQAVINNDIGGQSGQLPPPPRPRQTAIHLSEDKL